MKPLPEAVQSAFPCASDRLPERPWWGCCQHHDGVPRYRRNDDVPSHREQLVYIIHSTAEHTSAHDAKNPIPHPGYRAGQVWAAKDGGSIAIGAVHVHAVKPLQTANDLAGWLEWEFARAYPYLMADPACPHLAPWSPAEVKP